jgi:hypothetical protein
MKFPKMLAVLFLLCCATLLSAQAGGGRGWLASGLYAGARGQYRLPEKTYSVGYDGSWYTLLATGDRFDLPDLGPVLGYGAFVGFTSCEGRREPAYIASAAWSMAKGSGDTAIGRLDFVDHEVSLDLEMLFPLRTPGMAFGFQFGWDFDFFSVTDGFLPFGGSREDLLVSSFVGFDCGLGMAYVIGRRLLIEAKAVVRMASDNSVSGAGVSESVDGEIGRGEFSFELSAGLVL